MVGMCCQESGHCQSNPMQAQGAARYPACTASLMTFARGREPGHHAPLPHPQGLGPPRNRDIVRNSNAATRLQSHGLPRGVPGWQWTLTRGGEAELMGTTGDRVPGKPGERHMGLRSHGAPGTFRERDVPGNRGTRITRVVISGNRNQPMRH